MPFVRYPSLTVVVAGALWGLYWWPLRRLEALTGMGAWATLATLAIALACLAPAGWLGRAQLRAASARAHLSLLAGGAAFALYANALLYGQVAVVILLFYLTPVWSTLIARWLLHRPVAAWRYAALLCGLVGIASVLRGAHGGLPVPHATGDWLGLASGLLWAIAATGIHGHVRTRPAETNFVFCLGALVAALAMLPLLAGRPPAVAGDAILPVLGWLLLLGGGWWAASLTAFVAANQRLEPPRVGILLMGEVVVGALSAALLADEPFGPLIAVGAVLVVAAGVLESAPDLRARRDARPC